MEFNFTNNQNEILIFEQENFITKNNKETFLTRVKRLAHMLPMLGGLAGTNTIYSLGDGSAPFSWFGSLISKTTGLMHRDDFEMSLKIMANNTQMITRSNLKKRILV